MPSLNRCEFIGRLGGDPEMRYTPNGKPITKFSVAVDSNRRQNPQTGEWEGDPEWIDAVVVFGDLAEKAAERLRKGNLVWIEGRQETQKWTDKETGKPARRVTHIVTKFLNLTKREDADGDFAYGGYSSAPPVAAPAGAGGTSPLDDLDDLPF